MEKDTQVWLRDHDGPDAWLQGTVLSKSKSSSAGKASQDIVVQLESGETRTVPCLLGHSEADDLKLRNPEESDLVEDLIDLQFLHEPAILHTLYARFRHGLIYTFTGPILLAVNPYRNLPLYSDETLQGYYNAGLLRSQGMADLSEKVSPHVFAVADNAYRSMMDVMYKKVDGLRLNQAVLISGESGAGKTESTKIVMKYLTAVGHAQGRTDCERGSVTDRVLQSNPILEAFGNAQTNRNINSSRFGKYIELLFNARGNLRGARIETYLLEKVRLTSQQDGERNFHILYQISAKYNDSVLEKFGTTKEELVMKTADKFRYSSQGGVLKVDGINDTNDLQSTQRAMEVLEFSKQQQADVIRLIAGVLHLGQISFKEASTSGGDGSDIADSSDAREAMSTACRLFGVEEDILLESFTKRTIHVHGETYRTPQSPSQAVDSVAAIAKVIYVNLFEWVVHRVNESVRVEVSEGERASIGVLDIFGFESFESNSFEQLCINYTNETLQQHFNRFIFKVEQDEYDREGIEWSFINFPDNQDCLDLIEGRPDGIFAQLDDESFLGKSGSDENFVNRLYKRYCPGSRPSHEFFSASERQMRRKQFVVKHYAADVVYDSNGFFAKNKDELPKEAIDIFTNSSVGAMRDAHLLHIERAKGSASADGKSGGKSTKRAPSLGFQFCGQLRTLMTKLNACAPHFIRCIKPNDHYSCDDFAKRRIVDQLRYGGVLEAVRVSRSGFPVRLSHSDFYAHYRLLLGADDAKRMPIRVSAVPEEAQAQCQRLIDAVYEELEAEKFEIDFRRESISSLESHGQRRESFSMRTRQRRMSNTILEAMPVYLFDRRELQLGKSKVFMRKGAYEIIETARTRHLSCWICGLQALVRGWLQVRRFNATKKIALAAQCFCRRLLAQKRMEEARRTPAAIIVQSFARGIVARNRYIRLVLAVIKLQARCRGRGVRIAAQNKILLTNAVLALQGLFRVRRARKVLVKLRKEARKRGVKKPKKKEIRREIAAIKAMEKAKARKPQLVAAEKHDEPVTKAKVAPKKQSNGKEEAKAKEVVKAEEEVKVTGESEEKDEPKATEDAGAKGLKPILEAARNEDREFIGAPISREELKLLASELFNWKRKHHVSEKDRAKLRKQLTLIEKERDDINNALLAERRRTAELEDRLRLAAQDNGSQIPMLSVQEFSQVFADIEQETMRSTSPKVRRSILTPVEGLSPLSVGEEVFGNDIAESDSISTISVGETAVRQNDHDPEDPGTSSESSPEPRVNPVKGSQAWQWFEQFVVLPEKEVRVWIRNRPQQGLVCTLQLTDSDGVARLLCVKSKSFFGKILREVPIREIQRVASGHLKLFSLQSEKNSHFVTIVMKSPDQKSPSAIVIGFPNAGESMSVYQGLKNLRAAVLEIDEARTSTHRDRKDSSGGSTHATPRRSSSISPSETLPTCTSTAIVPCNKSEAKKNVEEAARQNSFTGGATATGLGSGDSSHGVDEDAKVMLSDIKTGEVHVLPSPALLTPLVDSMPSSEANKIQVKVSDVQKLLDRERQHYHGQIREMKMYEDELNNESQDLMAQAEKMRVKEAELVNQIRTLQRQKSKNEQSMKDDMQRLSRQLQEMSKRLRTKDATISSNTRVRMRLGKRIEELEAEKAVLEGKVENFARDRLVRTSTPMIGIS